MRPPRTAALALAASISAAVLASAAAGAATVPVSTAAELTAAVAAAKAGDEIVLADGTYKLGGLACSASGTAAAPIVVRGATRLGAKVEFAASPTEGFHVMGPYWTFEGLDIKGTCADDSDCEHAFHVVGHGNHFVMRGNRIVDFNAHLKVNNLPEGGTWVLPDDGLVESNELFDTRARMTGNPVTPLNIDNASRWTVRANFIHDFHKGGGDSISYAAFNKGGGTGALFERNLVICTLDEASGGTRVGLSFGGGGQDPSTCAPAFNPAVPCDPENTDGIMRNNIVVNCSDVGIYLNKAKNTKLLHNTLIATSGVDFRFTSSTGEAHGNVLASKIRGRDSGTFSGSDNLSDVAMATFTGWYMDPMRGDLRKKDAAADLSMLLDKGAAAALLPDDYCARARSDGKPDWGALEHSLGDCVTTRPVPGGGSDGGAADGGGSSGDAGTSDDAQRDANGDGGQGSDASGDGGGAPSSGGCGCRTAGSEASHWAWALAILLAIAGGLRRGR